MVVRDMQWKSTMSGKMLSRRNSSSRNKDLLLKEKVFQQDGEDFCPQAKENDCQRLLRSCSKRKREDPERSNTAEEHKHIEKRHRKCPGPPEPIAESRRPPKSQRAARRKPKENACASMLQKQLMAALQLASKAEEDAAATVAELAHARNGLRAALDAQQVALKKQEEVDEQLCSIRAERDAVAVHVLRAAQEAASAAAVLRRQASAGNPSDLRPAALEREASAAAHLAECQMEQDLAEAKERVRHLAAQLEEEKQWRTEAEAIFWEYGLVAPEFERHSDFLSLLTHPHSPPPAPSTPPLFENKAALPRLPVQQLLSRLRCMHK